MNKHTPGPWKAIPPKLGTAWVIDSGNPDAPIAMLYGANTPIQMKRARSGEAEANARLIAAAPELLAALQHVQRRLEARGGDFLEGTQEVVRAAIAKATGEAV